MPSVAFDSCRFRLITLMVELRMFVMPPPQPQPQLQPAVQGVSGFSHGQPDVALVPGPSSVAMEVGVAEGAASPVGPELTPETWPPGAVPAWLPIPAVGVPLGVADGNETPATCVRPDGVPDGAPSAPTMPDGMPPAEPLVGAVGVPEGKETPATPRKVGEADGMPRDDSVGVVGVVGVDPAVGVRFRRRRFVGVGAEGVPPSVGTVGVPAGVGADGV